MPLIELLKAKLRDALNEHYQWEHQEPEPIRNNQLSAYRQLIHLYCEALKKQGVTDEERMGLLTFPTPRYTTIKED